MYPDMPDDEPTSGITNLRAVQNDNNSVTEWLAEQDEGVEDDQAPTGHVLVESVVGKGSMFTVLIPRYHPQSEAETDRSAQGAEAITRDLTGAGTVLVVEDE